MSAVETVDITVLDAGSLVLLGGVSPEGEAWLAENLDPNALTWGSRIVVEPRYVLDILEGAAADGLCVR